LFVAVSAKGADHGWEVHVVVDNAFFSRPAVKGGLKVAGGRDESIRAWTSGFVEDAVMVFDG
jgi:hypothetical protein